MNQYNDIIQKSVEVLKSGGVILYPTDTIWGIGCDASNEEAVAKVYKIKQREESKSLIALLDDDRKLNRYVKSMPDVIWDILDFTTKPTTIIYDNAMGFAKNAISKDGSMAIRICKQEICQKIIQKLNKPLISTSANISGSNAPKSFLEISEHIKSQVDFILDIPEFYESKAKASTIIRIKENMDIQILRK